MLTALRYQLATGVSMGGGKQRARGLRLVAIDAGEKFGSGPEVSGTAMALLLAVSGRVLGTGELTGDGIGRFKGQVHPFEASYSICYDRFMTTDLATVAHHTDEVTALARSELVRAVRNAAAQGMTQSDIAQSIGRSQPEVSRLLRFHGRSSLARRLRCNADQIRHLVAEVGGTQVRVFGSVALGEDQPGSDVDLLFAMKEPLSLMQLGRLEQRIAILLDAPVDLVPESAVRPELRERVYTEAVSL